MDRWEYCIVAHAPSGPLLINVTYCTPQGAQLVQHRADSYEDGVNRLWPQVLAEIGRAGWELAAVDAGALYFKRELERG